MPSPLRIAVMLAMSVLLSKVTRAELSESKLRDLVTASTVYVMVDRGNGQMNMGTGWVFNAKEKTVMTAFHVTEGARQGKVFVAFAKRNLSGWVNEINAFQQASRLEPAKVVWESEDVDSTILHVPSMPDGLKGLPMVAGDPAVDAKLFTVGHPNIVTDIFHFSRLKVKYTGFAAITSKSLQIRSEIISVVGGDISPGASGSAVVDGHGRVVGLVSGQVGTGDNGTLIAASAVLRALAGSKTKSSDRSQALTGRWIGRFTNNGNEFGIEFTDDHQFAFVMPAGKLAGTFKVYGKSLYTKTDGKSEKLKIEWIDDNSFKFLNADFPVVCRRYDAE